MLNAELTHIAYLSESDNEYQVVGLYYIDVDIIVYLNTYARTSLPILFCVFFHIYLVVIVVGFKLPIKTKTFRNRKGAS